MKQGCIHIYHGDGKGKTTCAMGLCLRAVGAGKRVAIHQFLKNNYANERKVLEQLDQVFFVDGKEQAKFTNQLTPAEFDELCVFCKAKLDEVIALVDRERIDVLLLDEVLHLVYQKLLDEQVLVDFLTHKPASLEVIMTGYYPSPSLLQLADYVSHIQKEKHPYEQGLGARAGIEF